MSERPKSSILTVSPEQAERFGEAFRPVVEQVRAAIEAMGRALQEANFPPLYDRDKLASVQGRVLAKHEEA